MSSRHLVLLTLPLSLYPLSDSTSSSSSNSRYPFLPPPSTIVFLLIFLFPHFLASLFYSFLSLFSFSFCLFFCSLKDNSSFSHYFNLLHNRKRGRGSTTFLLLWFFYFIFLSFLCLFRFHNDNEDPHVSFLIKFSPHVLRDSLMSMEALRIFLSYPPLKAKSRQHFWSAEPDF